MREGVPTEVATDIPPSNTFIPVPSCGEAADSKDFKICSGNWPGAESDPFPKRRWPQVAVGKANIVKDPGRKPRLIIDPTVSSTNPCSVCDPGRFPVRVCSEEVGGFSLDIAAAHKTVRIRESERGPLGIKVGDRYYVYNVAPFGGAFSATGGSGWRGFHPMLSQDSMGVPRYDYVRRRRSFLQAIAALDMSACLILSFCQTCNCPTSWRKRQLGPLSSTLAGKLTFGQGHSS